MPLRSEEELKAIRATNISPRVIKAPEKLEFKCHNCDNVGMKSWSHANRSVAEKGWSFQCLECLNKKKAAGKAVTYSSEFLIKHNLVDTTSRIIKAHERVEIKCHGCDAVGTPKWTDAQKSLKRYGHAYQDKKCLNVKYAKRKEGGQWLDKIRAVAQTDAHKERARENGRKRLLIKNLGNINNYWVFPENIQLIAGTEIIEGVCKKCNTRERKPLKKFIEGSDNFSHGCSNCWSKYTQTDEYREEMGSRSSPSGSEARLRQGRSYKEYWKNLDPDLKEKHVALLREHCPEDKVFTSKGELEILEWVQSLGLISKKHQQGGKELDIFIPELNIGIEYNGLYWHSEANKSKNYHLDKTNYFKDQGIQVLHVFENEWKDRQDQVKSFLLSKLGKNNRRVGARKVEFKFVPTSDIKSFVEKYHIQGYPQNTKEAIGGYYEGELVLVTTFAKHHRNNDSWTINRFVCKEGWSVSGGLSKSSKMGFEKFGELISWCDLRWSNGSGYERAGWQEEERLSIDYFYTNGRNVVSKQSRKKSIVGTPPEITEHEHALSDGLLRVYDCGKIRYIYK